MRANFSHRGTLRPALLLVLVIGFVVSLQVTPAFAADITVTTSADDSTDNNNCTLREAIEAANTNVAVDLCAAGSPSSTDRILFHPSTNGTGNEITLTLGALDPITGQTIIDGNGISNTIIQAGGTEGSVSHRIFEAATSGTVNISNMTLRFGGDGSSPTYGGCVLYSGSGGGQISEVTFDRCHAVNGGAIAVTAGTGVVSITTSSLINNTATYGGAAYAATGGRISIFGNSYLTGNDATDGGAIYVTNSGRFTGTQISIVSNTASSGAAFYGTGTKHTMECELCCIVGNGDTAVIQLTTGSRAEFYSNWWGSEWGPRILSAGATGSGTSTGDSISGDGMNYVDVDFSSIPADYGDMLTGPTGGDFLTSAPTLLSPAGTCPTCDNRPSGNGTGRNCFLP